MVVVLPALLAALVAWQLGAILAAAGDEDRVRSTAGAVALAFALAVGTIAAGLLDPAARAAQWALVAGSLVLLAGLWRDLERGVRGLTPVALLTAALLVVVCGDVHIATLKPPFSGHLVELGRAGPVVTVLWIVAVGWLVRATDPLPGLTAGLGALAAGTFLVVALTRGRESLASVPPVTAPLAAVLAGACLGLLTPGLGARALSLGRGGATLLGFLLGVLTVVGTLKHTAFLLVGLPLLALAVPVLNLWYMRRAWVRAGRHDPAALDRARTLGDMLDRRGFTHSRSVGMLLGLQAYCCLVALVLVGLVTVSVVLKVLLLVLLLPLAVALFFLATRVAARVAGGAAGKVEILGAPIDAVSYDEALARVAAMVAEGGPHHIFTADVSGIMQARQDPELLAILRSADLVTADGAGVLWAARIFDFPLPERVSGVDLVRRISGLAAERGYRVFLLGAKPGVAEDAAAELLRENPGLNLCGVQHGYFESEEAVAATLREAKPEVVFVALGIPRQERFIRHWCFELGIPVSMGVGGSFDVVSGRLDRAPGWMQRSGLEWLFRVKQEPKRWRRLFVLPKFVSAIAWESWRRWRQGEGR
ncbi:MAG: WecB/TagA/CpsF family glycosyltransferase [Armatimonadetes bacterium]|nr:WecB/TagA/CpsF family glycosyltransferase [Armatimonadota bacterium]